jgi:hypothetical protein
MRRGSSNRSARLAALVAAVAASVSLGSAFLPWITAGVGVDAATHSGLEVPAAAVPVIATALLVVLLCLGCVCISPSLSPFAALAALLGAIFAATSIALLEAASMLLPTEVLPETVRRSAVALGAGFGLWLALAGLAVAAVALHAPLATGLARRFRAAPRDRRRAAALFGLAIVTVAIGWLRYRSWIDASFLGRRLDLPAAVAPWIGPLSLLSVWMLVGAVGLAGFHRADLAGLLAAAAGWLTSLLAALVLLAVGTIGRLGVESLALPGLQGSTGFGVTGFVWAAFLAGLLAAAIGACLVCIPERPGGVGSWR